MTKLIGWFFLLISLPIWILSLDRIVDRHASEAWPRTRGEVVSSEVYRRSGKSSTDWCIKLHYTYVVNNEVFSSKRLSTSWMSSSACDRDKALIESRFERLRPGAPIRVRYNPARPGKAIIYLDDLTGLYIFLALALVLLAGGVKAIREGAAMASRRA